MGKKMEEALLWPSSVISKVAQYKHHASFATLIRVIRLDGEERLIRAPKV